MGSFGLERQDLARIGGKQLGVAGATRCEFPVTAVEIRTSVETKLQLESNGVV